MFAFLYQDKKTLINNQTLSPAWDSQLIFLFLTNIGFGFDFFLLFGADAADERLVSRGSVYDMQTSY